jgi:hypothetical protein
VSVPVRVLVYGLVYFVTPLVTDALFPHGQGGALPAALVQLAVLFVALALELGVERSEARRREPVPPGWYYRECSLTPRLRYWDGARWTAWIVKDEEPVLESERARSLNRLLFRHPFLIAIAIGCSVAFIMTALLAVAGRELTYVRENFVDNVAFCSAYASVFVVTARYWLLRPPRSLATSST